MNKPWNMGAYKIVCVRVIPLGQFQCVRLRCACCQQQREQDVCYAFHVLFCFPEGENDGQQDEYEADEVVPADGFALEDGGHDDGEDRQRDALGQYLELHQREGTAVDLAADAIGGYHERVFEEGHAPRCEDDEDERPAGVDFQLSELEVAVPGEGHEDVADDEQQDGDQCFGHLEN